MFRVSVASAMVAASVSAPVAAGPGQAVAGQGSAQQAHEAAAALVVACRGGEGALLGVFEAVGGTIVFSLPGGGARAGEDPAATAERETLEETGYRVRAGEGVATPASEGTALRVMQARVIEHQPRRPLSSEIIAAAWVDPRRIPANGWRFDRDRQWVPRLFERHTPPECR